MSTYLFEYTFAGETFGLTVEAANEIDALLRVKAMGSAAYLGEVDERIPVPQPWAPKVVS